MQLFVGDPLDFVFALALPDNCGLGAPVGLEMAIEAIDAHVQRAVSKPGMLDLPGGTVPSEFASHGRGLEPFQRPALFQPEGVRVAHRLLVHLVIALCINPSAADGYLGGWETAGFLQK